MEFEQHSAIGTVEITPYRPMKYRRIRGALRETFPTCTLLSCLRFFLSSELGHLYFILFLSLLELVLAFLR